MKLAKLAQRPANTMVVGALFAKLATVLLGAIRDRTFGFAWVLRLKVCAVIKLLSSGSLTV